MKKNGFFELSNNFHKKNFLYASNGTKKKREKSKMDIYL
jgi:hypothetical protein